MRNRAPVSFFLAASFAATACNGSATPHQPVAPASAKRADPVAPPGHGDELLPGLPGIAPAAGAPATDALPTDRDGLLRAGREALAQGRLDEALSIAEVLLLVQGTGDLEARELRGRCLAASGDDAAAREEFSACCAAGHTPCCNGGQNR